MKVLEYPVGSNGATLTAYIQHTSTELASVAKRPAVLIFPGGGYMFCSDREAEPVALAYLAEGYNAFVLRYTVGHGAGIAAKALQDAEHALTSIRKNQENWNLLPDKMAITGFSAGGHLAAALATMGNVRPDALILGYPCILENMMRSLGSDAPGLESLVDDKTPPTFLFHTCTDPIVPVKNSMTFAEALDAAGIPFELHIFGEGQHGLSLAKPLTANGDKEMDNPMVAQWFALSIDWLHTLWGDFPVENSAALQEVYSGVTKTPLAVLEKRVDMWREILELIPALQAVGEHESARRMSLEQIAAYSPEAVPQVALEQLLRKYPQ